MLETQGWVALRERWREAYDMHGTHSKWIGKAHDRIFGCSWTPVGMGWDLRRTLSGWRKTHGIFPTAEVSQMRATREKPG